MKKTDAEIAAAKEIWDAAEEHFKEEMARRESEMEGKLEEAKAIGILQKIEYDLAHNELLKYAVLHQIKQKKSYLKGGMTWEVFCKTVFPQSARTIERNLGKLKKIFDEFSDKLSDLAGVPFNKIRYLGETLSLKSVKVSDFDDDIIIDGVKIPLSAENKDDIEAAIDALKESQKRQSEDTEAKLRAKDRVLEAKERVIRRQEKDLLKYQREVEARGFEPGEENYIRDMENLKTLLVGFELKLDWRNMPEDATPLMKAAYIETIGHAARVFRAYYDTAKDMFGNPEMDDDWEFPNLRANAEQQKDETQSCAQCEHRKAMNNPQKGVKIPGEFGKCIRPGGLCERKSRDKEN